MNILHVIFSMNTGGSETMLVDILNEQVTFPESKIGLLIINNKFDSSVTDKIDDRVKIIFNNRIEGSKNPWSIIRMNMRIIKFKADFIHIHDQNAINLIFQPKRKKILTVHDVGLFDKSWFNCGNLCAISKAVKDDIYSSCGITSNLVYNGVNFSRITPKSSFLKKDKFRLLQISRLDHCKKGQDVLINALSLLKKEHPTLDLYLDFIGEGTSMEFLKDMVKELSLENNIRFLGLKDRNYIYAHLSGYDLLVQPSNYEGFGLTVVEGMASKIPVLVSDIDGPMEIIQNGKYGFYFEKGNVQDCANSIYKIINTDNLDDYVNDAYIYANDNFNIRNTSENYWKLYTQRLSN